MILVILRVMQMNQSHDIVIEKYNELYLLIHTERDILYSLYDYFSFFAEGYQYQSKYKMGFWDGKIHLLNLNKKLLPIGLLNQLLRFCKENEYTIKAINKEGLKPLPFGETLDVYFQEMDRYTKYTFTGKYSFQFDAVKYALQNQRCIILSPTACLDPDTQIEVLLDDDARAALSEYRKQCVL